MQDLKPLASCTSVSVWALCGTSPCVGQVLVGYWKQSVGFFCSCLGYGTAFDVHAPAFLEVPSGTRLGTCTHARERASYFLGRILLTTLRRLISEEARTKGSCLSPVKQVLVLFFLSVRWARILPHIHQVFFLGKGCQCMWSNPASYLLV